MSFNFEVLHNRAHEKLRIFISRQRFAYVSIFFFKFLSFPWQIPLSILSQWLKFEHMFISLLVCDTFFFLFLVFFVQCSLFLYTVLLFFGFAVIRICKPMNFAYGTFCEWFSHDATTGYHLNRITHCMHDIIWAIASGKTN